MPLYTYTACSTSDHKETCMLCSKEFEVYQKITDATLEHCPKCKREVKKCIANVNSPRKTHFSYGKAKDAGFTVLKKQDKGVYEKL